MKYFSYFDPWQKHDRSNWVVELCLHIAQKVKINELSIVFEQSA